MGTRYSVIPWKWRWSLLYLTTKKIKLRVYPTWVSQASFVNCVRTVLQVMHAKCSHSFQTWAWYSQMFPQSSRGNDQYSDNTNNGTLTQLNFLVVRYGRLHLHFHEYLVPTYKCPIIDGVRALITTTNLFRLIAITLCACERVKWSVVSICSPVLRIRSISAKYLWQMLKNCLFYVSFC